MRSYILNLGTQAFSGAEEAVALFGRDDDGGHPHVGGHTMDLTLRPGEKLVLRWDNIGKVAAGKLTNDSAVACDFCRLSDR